MRAIPCTNPCWKSWWLGSGNPKHRGEPRERLHGQMGGVVEGGWMSHRYFSWSHTNSIFSAQKSLEIPKKCRNITQEAPLRRNSWGVFTSLSQCKVNLLAGLCWDLKFAQFSGSKMSSLGSCERVDLQSKGLFGSGSQSSEFLVRVSFARWGTNDRSSNGGKEQPTKDPPRQSKFHQPTKQNSISNQSSTKPSQTKSVPTQNHFNQPINVVYHQKHQ